MKFDKMGHPHYHDDRHDRYKAIKGEVADDMYQKGYAHATLRLDLETAVVRGTEVTVKSFVAKSEVMAGHASPDLTDHDRHTLIDCLLAARDREYEQAAIIADFNDDVEPRRHCEPPL